MLNVYYVKELPSTNDYLKDHYKNLPNFSSCITSFQTRGKGRMGRSWVGNKDENIALSILIKEKINVDMIEQITLAVACTVHKFLSCFVNDIKIKWPNDLLVNNKKICGILTEGISLGDKVEAIIIGIGINVRQKNFTMDLQDTTTSISKETNRNLFPMPLAIELAGKLQMDIKLFLDNKLDYLTYMKNNLYGLGELVSFYEGLNIHQGIIEGILTDGRIIIRENQTKKYIRSGEIKIIRK